MKKFKFQSLLGICFILLFCLNVSLVLAGLITNGLSFVVAAIILSALQIAAFGLFKRKQSVLRNYPFKAALKYLSGRIHPLLLKLFSENDQLKAMVNSKQYDLIVSRANNIPTNIVSNTLLRADEPGFEYLKTDSHTKPVKLNAAHLRVKIGNEQCTQPYSLSILNIEALTQKGASNSSLLALSGAANISGLAINTGKGGISSHLLRGGGDLIWQIMHEDPAFRKTDSSFNEKLFQVTATRPYIKMIEMALPVHEESIMKRLSRNRMLIFLNGLRSLSGGKPVGIRLFNPGKEIIAALCQSMLSAEVYLDFITIDRAMPLIGSDASNIAQANNSAYLDTLAFTAKVFENYDLPVKLLFSGPVVTEYDILKAIALGASACYSTIPLALSGDSGHLLSTKGNDQRTRIANFLNNTVRSTIKLMESCAYRSLEDVNANHFYRKVQSFEVRSLKEIYIEEHPTRSPYLFTGMS
ncbi:hypothetical protein BDE36_2153 [Arcticibacter tournemirensis]|uniref:Glutamate synthase domain-containing protein n=1 Tax=Arcticibacter tournemirensis TaxID=699437 RepID=A0A4Q0MA22_9SPHI|nr:hypothetical protein [Arcticibacter tournemirensis]KAA8485307.1 hypothetical protein F1649_04090 [Arcticibacter tournemirensis]RXF70004.1 hypothetical protein EKH83_08935 [Arcticibacter tournemirensis]TQM50407.1 hypothetical protein BDE36_2153 [Arcticibacter tournemirensis]